MTTIAQTFTRLAEENRKGLLVYLTAGCPNYEVTREAVLAVAAAGADIVEIGMPFSDPMADGPVIQKAAALALKNGATTQGTLQLIKDVRQQSEVPLLCMTYINTVLQYDPEKFVQDFSRAGIGGLIVPDLPVEESVMIDAACKKFSVDNIQFIAPTSTEERLLLLAAKAQGFLYCISSTGVTGVRLGNYNAINAVINQARRYTSLPTAIGFGIGSTEAACAAAEQADAVIIGSAVMQRLMDDGVGAVKKFVAEIRSALDDGRG